MLNFRENNCLSGDHCKNVKHDAEHIELNTLIELNTRNPCKSKKIRSSGILSYYYQQ